RTAVSAFQRRTTDMEKKRRRPRGSVFQREDSPYWYIGYSVAGRIVRKNTHLLKEKDASKLLDSRLGAIANGDTLPCDVSRTTVAELLELVHTDYKVNALKSLDDMERRTRLHIAPFFFVLMDEDSKFTGGMKATQVTTDALNRYVVARQGNGASNASVNRELSILRRGFTLGMTAT